MLKPINSIIKDSIGNIIYRGNVVTGTVATDNGDGSYDVFISESDRAYPKIFTLSRNPDLAVGDKVRILYKNGDRNNPIILPPVAPSALTLFENYLADGATNFATFYGDTHLRGLTFLTESAHTINYIELLLARSYSGSIPGTIYIEIYAVDGNNIPTGDILTSGETDGNTLTYAFDNPGVNREWRRIDLTEINLLNNTTYAITLHLIGGTSFHSAGIWLVESGSYVNGGALYTFTGEENWAYQWWNDSGFKIYGKTL